MATSLLYRPLDLTVVLVFCTFLVIAVTIGKWERHEVVVFQGWPSKPGLGAGQAE